MNSDVQPTCINRNRYWMNNRGAWLTWLFTVAVLHFFLLCMPFITTPTVWTLTHLIHNVVVYIMFHYVKGTPFVAGDQGETKRLTSWEQMDNGEQETSSRKFIIFVTVLLFLLASVYTFGDRRQTIINLLTLGLGVIPKLSIFHKFRFLGINKY